MAEAENAAETTPSEPDRDARPRTDGDSIPPLDVESLQILVSPPGQEGTPQDSPGVPADRVETSGVEASEISANSEL
jgi:hypothetical protein